MSRKNDETPIISEDDKIYNITDPLFEVVSSTYKNLLQDRIILINGEIKEDIIEKAVIQVALLSQNKPRTPITILINSFGGSPEDAQALVDMIQYTKTPITTIVLGKAMSAAFDIFLAGDYRIAYANSILMCHAGSEAVKPSPIPFIKDLTNYHLELFKRWSKYYASRTKLPYDEWYKIIESGKDRYFFPEEALKVGIIHDIHSPQQKHKPLLAKKRKHKKAKARHRRRRFLV